ncbi:MAG: outer membrane beta-barrel protein [Pseudomonadales bacterium]|nr:outer membrane beta-barrel protein [Pseudomonadales bacterium]
MNVALTSVALLSVAAQPVVAHEAGDWILRLGAAAAQPDASSSIIHSSALGALAGTGVDVKDNTQLGINLVYMVTNNLGVELLAATPFEHDLKAEGLSFTDLGSTKHLPPTVTANYFFGPSNSAIRPYLGVGVNYTTFFSEKLSHAARNELGLHSLKLEDSWGLAWRGGVDWEINTNWLVNASFWKIDMETDASARSSLEGGVGVVKTKVDVDPWVYMISLGYKF